jgi:3-oxoacyl-[acyl-carrier protein] reductase
MPTGQSRLSKQVAVVTGGGHGIGAAVASTLASLGAEVIITGRDLGKLESTASGIRKDGGRCSPVECDVRQLASVEALVEQVRTRHQGCDILVNNAGIGTFNTPLHQLAPEQFDAMMETNLRGPYYLMRGFVPLMITRGSGHIINVSSLASHNPVPNAAAYAASKWGLNGLSVSAAEELRAHNIRVSLICPGSTDTSMMSRSDRKKDKMLQPSDVAHVVEMLVTQTTQSFVSEVLIRPTQKP